MSRGYIRYLLDFYAEKEERKAQRRIIRNFSDHLLLPENEFLENYKVSQEMVNYLCQELEVDFAPQTGCLLMPKWIIFPANDTARRAVAANFEEKCRLPDILGAIDCTHVADVDCRILHVNANYPGRVHDQFIFNYSNVKDEMKRLFQNRIGQYYLLGDSGYALEPWMIIPIRDAARNTPEQRFTDWHCQTRNVVERTNGYLKGTFRCLGLDRRLHYEPKKASDIIYACCTLYNIMKHFRIPMEMGEFVDEIENFNLQPQAANFQQAGLQRRANIINTFFI